MLVPARQWHDPTVVLRESLRRLSPATRGHQLVVDFPDEAMRFGKALHTAIAEIAANAWALRLHDQVASQMERYRRFTNNSETRRHDALAQHRELVEAIKARDPRAASQLAFDHVIGARDEALRAVGSDSLHAAVARSSST